jgi:SOS-response transcriptional repressors (RecA-mediated autopeptidases)
MHNIFSSDSHGAGSEWKEEHSNPSKSTRLSGQFFENPIDLNEQLIKNKDSTFFMRINSDAMEGAGIYKGDVVIVDRSLIPENGKIVIAVINHSMLIRYYEKINKKERLVPASSKAGCN